ncbi:phage scaffolding protein [Allofournierella sp. CML151]|uniref:phage scaffolding protein n=1 Tax=Allofournierella sp. CML151 TaxID=2998082 RepID=UPI0022EA6AB8|nr:phage scaffolding protein [Fournierella sp. CML151]
MQEWLKELLGEAYTPQLEESLTAALAQRFVNREELDTRQARWKTELETARAQAADWKQQAEQARKSAEEQVAAARFDAALNTAIGRAGGRSEKAIRALLDLDSLRTSADPEGAIAAALEQLEQENGYLFGGITPPPYAAGTGAGAPGGEPDELLRRAFGLGRV